MIRTYLPHPQPVRAVRWEATDDSFREVAELIGGQCDGLQIVVGDDILLRWYCEQTNMFATTAFGPHFTIHVGDYVVIDRLGRRSVRGDDFEAMYMEHP